MNYNHIFHIPGTFKRNNIKTFLHLKRLKRLKRLNNSYISKEACGKKLIEEI